MPVYKRTYDSQCISALYFAITYISTKIFLCDNTINNYSVITVPAFPFNASLTASKEVISTRPSLLEAR